MRVEGLWFKVEGLRNRDKGSVSKVSDSGVKGVDLRREELAAEALLHALVRPVPVVVFRVYGPGFRIQGSGCRV